MHAEVSLNVVLDLDVPEGSSITTAVLNALRPRLAGLPWDLWSVFLNGSESEAMDFYMPHESVACETYHTKISIQERERPQLTLGHLREFTADWPDNTPIWIRSSVVNPDEPPKTQEFTLEDARKCVCFTNEGGLTIGEAE